MVKGIVLGFPVGFLFGYTLQRGRLCLNTAFLNGLLLHDFTLLRAYLLAVLIQMVTVNTMTWAGWITAKTPPFFWAADMVGGFIFGVGMALVGGCASAIWFRFGEGSAAAGLAILGYMISIMMTAVGIFRPVMKSLREPLISPEGGVATLATLIGIDLWLPVILILILGIISLARAPAEGYLGGWSWRRTGLAIGAIGTIAWMTSEMAGRQGGLGTVEPSAALLRLLMLGDYTKINWATYMLVGIPVGSFVAAKASGEFLVNLPPPQRLLKSLLGGWLMGVGAAISGGCTIGHGISGVPLLAAGSIVAMTFIVFGSRTTVYLLGVRR